MYVVQSTLPIPYKAHGFDSKAAVEKTFVEPCIRGCGLVEGWATAWATNSIPEHYKG